jgi:hypothetical protein
MPLTVVDNDVPTVTLALNPVTVSEGDGTQASQLTVVRDPVSDRALQIRWQSGAAGVLLPPTTTLPAGQPSATLPVGIQDNVLVDGTREVTLRGDILESGTSTAVAATSAATLTILDEDGPTLRLVLERKLVGEGLTPATEGTVIRNTDSTAALTVTLTSSDTTELVVPATLVLPAGASLASFQANSLNDDQSDGNQTVVVTASAEGFSPGVDNLVVSDRDLPDLVVTVTEGPAVAVTDEWMPVTYRIQNQGVQPAGPRWTTRVFLSRDAIPGDDTLLGNYVFGGTIAPGLYFEQTVSVRMPVVPGNYWVVTQTDVGNEIGETLEDNNTRVSAQPIRVGPAYTATVATDLNSALAGTPVPMTGRALRPNGEAAPEGSLVNIHIYVRGTQRIISALVDRQGQFAVTWQPLAQEAGDYEIGAAHPGEAQAPVQDGFILVGMRADPAFGTLRVVEGGTVEGRVQFLNASTLPLTGLGLTVLEKPSNILLETELGAQVIPGTGQVALTFQVTATDASTPGGLIRFRVETTEGAFAEAAVGVTIEALRPKLAVVPGSLTAGMLRGETRAVKAQVSNTGGRPTGWLNVSLPSVPWLSVASLNPAPSLEPGESMEVTLLLAPPADLALGPYQGSLHVGNAEVGLQVPFTFRAVSDRLGDLKVEVVDEYTYYAEGSPKVAEATVTVRDPFTFDRVAEAVTSESGTVVFPGLVEGYYDVRITAAKHTGYQQNVLVEPGQENLHTAFVSRETVRYTWKVEPVEVEDHYKITIETEFETVVPAPVITVEPAVIDLGQITTGVAQVDIKVTNHGLIQADNFHLQFPTHPLWEFSPLIDEVGVLPARSSLTIPLTIRKVGGGPALSGATISGSGTHGGGPCHTSANATWELICGPFNASYSSTISMPNANSGCGTRPVAPGSIYGWAPGSGPSGPGTPGGGSVSGPSVAVKIVCDPKCLVLAGLGCVPGPVGCFFGGFGCGMGLGGGVSALTILDCAVAAAGCLIPPAAVPACIYAFMRCFIQPASGAALAAHEFRLYEYLHGRRQLGLASSADPVERFRPGVQSMLDVLGEVLGAPDQVWLNPSAGANTGDWYQRFLGMVTEGSDGGRQVTASEQAALLEGVQPPGVEPSEVLRMIARWNRTLDYWSRGVMGPGDVEPGESSDFIDFHALQAKLEAATAAHEEARQYGYNDPIEAIVETIRVQNDEGGEGGTCARIKLRLEQEAVITRDAFQATLEIDNQDVGDMTDIEIRVFALDAEGRDASDYFGLRPPTLSGLSAVDGSGRVGAGSTGSAKWLIIPTVDAAPDVPLTYYIAGEFAYAVGGTRVRIPLEPVSITVLPTPRLWMKYFHQRDVFSDDPFTDEVEPSLPYNLAVMVENRGQGSARNMRITSAEPQIVENEKGLLIDFKIIATEVAGQNLTPSLTVNLGDILPGQTVIGRWLMTSSLHGLFTDYKASFEHVDGLGNPRLSLIEDLSIHEMIRLVRAGGAFEDGKPDFFVNQVPDPLDLGDTLYLSSGETNAVERVDEATVVGTLAPDNLTLVVQAAMPNEWGYLRLPDPADGQYDLVWVERMDGTRVLADNVWVTDRTFVGLGKRPKREHLLHLLDHGGSGGYTLHYDALPVADAVSPISRVNNLPASTTASFAVSWQGQDNEGGTGIQYYDLWVSEDGGPAIVWLSRTPLTTALYSGEVGRRYAFYSRATDRAGNQESAPAAAQASTLVAFASAAPVLGAISDQTTDEDVPLTGLPVVVSDPDTPLDQLVFTVDSSNRTLLVPARVSLTGSGGDRILSLTPERDRFGSTDITLTVSDGTHRDTRTFRVTVIPVNDPPVAGEDRMERSPFGRSKVSVSTLLTNDIDPESDDIRFVGVSPVSALGGQVVESGGWVFYTPPLGDPAPDSFTYTITDLAGATATGRVQVGLPGSGGTPELHVLSAERGPDGTIRVRLFGVPGRRYQIQVTDALPTATWTVLQEIEVGPNGLLILDDLEAVGQATRFYRAYSP